MSDDRRTRAITAGLSATGAAAGVGGLAYGLHDVARSVKAGKKIPLKTKALIPLEVAGLGGELMATKILHADAKRMKGPTVVKSIGIAQSNGHGRRIRDEDVAKAAPTAVVRGAKAGVLAAKKPKSVEGISDLRRRYNASLENALNAKTGTTIGKARRFDPEADRQRRLGAYAGLAGGGAILTGERFGREVVGGRIKGRPGVRGVGLRRGKVGAAYGAATLGLAGLGLGAAKRGVSERNQTWS